MTEILFQAHAFCVPPTATAQHHKVRRGRNGRVSYYDPSDVRDAKQFLRETFEPLAPKQPLTGAIHMEQHWVFPYRKTESKRRCSCYALIPKDTPPDFDNLSKGFDDVLESIGYFTNDGGISRGDISTWWGVSPGIFLIFYRHHPQQGYPAHWTSNNEPIEI